MNLLADLLLATFPYSTEVLCLAMSIQGSMAVRRSIIKNKTHMHWFHAFIRSTLTAYAGATFTNVFMGRPTAMLSNDIFFGACLLGYGLVNCTPFNIGYLVCNSTVGEAVVTIFSQLFRVGGIVGFSDAAFGMLKDNPSPYYDIPIFGPILFPSMLGNMGGFFFNGVDGYLQKGMPWLFQQSISCSTFYHFYAHDASGIIGTTLRSFIHPLASPFMIHLMGATEDESNDDALFAKLAVGLFMLSMAILRLDICLGDKFSPFHMMYDIVMWPFSKKNKKNHVTPKKKKTQ